jgi:hypothetical protein
MCMIMQRCINTPMPRLPWSHFCTPQGQRDRVRWLFPHPHPRAPPPDGGEPRVQSSPTGVLCSMRVCAKHASIPVFLSAPSQAMPLCSPAAFLRSRPPSPSHITIAACIFPLHVLFRGESPRIAAAAPHPGGRAERRRRDGSHAVAPRDVNKD